MKKILLAVSFVVLTVAGVLAWGIITSHKRVAEAPQANQIQQPEARQAPTTVRITAVGDNIPHDSVNAAAKTGDSYDYTPLFSEVKKYLSSGDITYCNQESPSAGQNLGISGYPTFNAPTEFARDLQKSGCNVINLANNHIADKGQEGIDLTIDLWKSLNPLAYAGANRSPQEQMQPRYFEVNGIKFAFIAFTDLSNNSSVDPHSVNMFSNDYIEKIAQEASKNADYVIASAHWGVEDSATVSPSQRGWAEAMANAGVDLILGAGPHVLQPVEIITTDSGRQVPVWYSLGNFLSSQLTVDQLIGGIAVMDFDISSGRMELAEMSFLPTYMHFEWTPEQAAAEDLMARKNLKLYPLEASADLINKTQLNTTVETQTSRITDLLNSQTAIKIMTVQDF